MRKFTIIVLSILLVFALNGCGNTEEAETKTEDITDTTKNSSHSSYSKSNSTNERLPIIVMHQIVLVKAQKVIPA